MISVQINGQQSPITAENLPRLTDLIEVVKDSINPGHMITDLSINGRDLTDEDWQLSPRNLGDVTIEVTTDTPANYLSQRVPMAPQIIDNCYLMFRETRKAFQEGNSRGGNELLRAAVDNLQAFVQWYRVMLNLMPEDQRSRYSIDPEVMKLTPTLERICTQQLTQAWKATGDTLAKDLEPQLDDLNSRLRQIISTELGSSNRWG